MTKSSWKQSSQVVKREKPCSQNTRDGWKENIETVLLKHKGQEDPAIIKAFLEEKLDAWEW